MSGESETKYPTQFDEVVQFGLLGKTLRSVLREDRGGQDVLRFETTDGQVWEFGHDQSCGESVQIESIDGDLSDLLDAPLVMAEEATRRSDDNRYDSETWTFYRFATRKGYVTVRWIGESNGYYSESVDVDAFDAEKRRLCWRCGEIATGRYGGCKNPACGDCSRTVGD